MAAESIVAVATPKGRGGIGVVRISGSDLGSWLPRLIDRPVVPRRAVHGAFIDAGGALIDQGVLLFFPAPASFTGEDVIELQGHGSPVVMDMLVRRALELGARPARAGEFSERAFLNGKLDLVQAEAVADLVAAESEAAARAALRSLQGEFSRQVERIGEQLIQLRVLVEAGLDFSDQDIEFVAAEAMRQKLAALVAELTELMAKARQGSQLREGFRIAIVGRPNAGKSSLFNALSGLDAAIVTAAPGTTRDVMKEAVEFEGISFQLLDTAGLRESLDPIEREGMRRARDALANADQVLLVIDAQGDVAAETAAFLADELTGQEDPERLTLVLNKIDLSGHTPGRCALPLHAVAVSVATGAGMDVLRAHLVEIAVGGGSTEGQFMARRRHLAALAAAFAHLRSALDSVERVPPELIAEELRQAHQELGRITGTFGSDDLLGQIFSGFCIGK